MMTSNKNDVCIVSSPEHISPTFLVPLTTSSFNMTLPYSFGISSSPSDSARIFPVPAQAVGSFVPTRNTSVNLEPMILDQSPVSNSLHSSSLSRGLFNHYIPLNSVPSRTLKSMPNAEANLLCQTRSTVSNNKKLCNSASLLSVCSRSSSPQEVESRSIMDDPSAVPTSHIQQVYPRTGLAKVQPTATAASPTCILSELLQSRAATTNDNNRNSDLNCQSDSETVPLPLCVPKHVSGDNQNRNSLSSVIRHHDGKKLPVDFSSFNMCQLIENKIKMFYQENGELDDPDQECCGTRVDTRQNATPVDDLNAPMVTQASTLSAERKSTSTSAAKTKHSSVANYIDSVIRNSISECHEQPGNFVHMIDQIVANVFNCSSSSSTQTQSSTTMTSPSTSNSSIAASQVNSYPTVIQSNHPRSSQSAVCSESKITVQCADGQMETSNSISENTYLKLVEFEFSHEKILKKFKTEPLTSIKVSDLNQNEQVRINELEDVLHPLQFCLSAMSRKQAILKQNIHRCFFQDNPNVSFDFQQKTMIKTAESSINLLISLTKKLNSFANLQPDDQMSLLRSSVMEIMVIRAILITSQRPSELAEGGQKRPLESHKESSPVASEHRECCNTLKTTSPGSKSVPSCSKHAINSILEQCPDLNDSDSLDQFTLSEDDKKNDLLATEYGRKFRNHYKKLLQSIDPQWYGDKVIFYLLFAILLFRPTRSTVVEIDRIREEHLTYVYLLKRYLEQKFKTYCTARSHFIRLIDRLEELQEMNDKVIQKLLDFDLAYAQNLLEKLYIC